MSANSRVNEQIRHVFVTLKSKKKDNSEAERSLGLLAFPGRPEGTNVKPDNSYSGHTNCPSLGLPSHRHCREKAECSIFRYETQASGASTWQLQFTNPSL